MCYTFESNIPKRIKLKRNPYEVFKPFTETKLAAIMSDIKFHDHEKDELILAESVNQFENINKNIYASCSLCKKQKGTNRCSLHSGSSGKNLLQKLPNQTLQEIKKASLSGNPSSVYGDRTFTIYINGLPVLISSVEPFVNPQKLFSQSGLLFLDVTSQMQMTKVSESLKQKYGRSLADSESERERLRKKLKIHRIQIARIDQRMSKCRKGEEHNITMEDTESADGCVLNKVRTIISSTPCPELCMTNQTFATTVLGNCKMKGHDAYGNNTNLEKITLAANEIALLTRRISNLKKELQKSLTLIPPPILLLPSACNGCVRVHANHYYHTAKFIGEHLCLTGRLEPFLVAPLTHEANSFLSRDCEGLVNISGQDLTNISMECTNSTSCNVVTHEMNSTSQVSENEWVQLEMVGIHNYLKKHPNATAGEFFKLQTEERAAYTTKPL